jgi:hypothetical protein
MSISREDVKKPATVTSGLLKDFPRSQAASSVISRLNILWRGFLEELASTVVRTEKKHKLYNRLLQQQTGKKIKTISASTVQRLRYWLIFWLADYELGTVTNYGSDPRTQTSQKMLLSKSRYIITIQVVDTEEFMRIEPNDADPCRLSFAATNEIRDPSGAIIRFRYLHTWLCLSLLAEEIYWFPGFFPNWEFSTMYIFVGLNRIWRGIKPTSLSRYCQ